jgi:amino acid transporter
LTFYRIAVFYVLSVFFLGMLVPYNSPQLKTAISKSTSASASPFVVAIQISGIQALPAILNACVLVFVFSAANSDLYIASRTIYGLAAEGLAPRILSHTNKAGVPVYALLLSSLFSCLGYLNVSTSSAVVFTYFTNLVTVFGILTWISVLVTHIFFVRARKAQSLPDSSMVYTAPFGLYGTYFALFVCIIIALFKNFSVFVHSSATGGNYGNFDYKNFITGYLGIPIYLIMFCGYKILHKTKIHKPLTVDLFSGKQEIDDEENVFSAMQNEKVSESLGWYKFISWLI